MDTKPSCPNCGADIEVVERRGHYENLRCTKCDWQFVGTALYPEELASLGASKNIDVKIKIAWDEGRVTANQVAAAKKIIPKLHDKSLSSMMQDFASSPTYDLGVYPEWSAKELQEKAGQLGLKLVIEPIETAKK